MTPIEIKALRHIRDHLESANDVTFILDHANSSQEGTKEYTLRVSVRDALSWVESLLETAST